MRATGYHVMYFVGQDVPAWQVLLQQTVAGALMYGIGYLAIRKMPVRTK